MSVAWNCEKKVITMPKWREMENDRFSQMAEMITDREPVPYSLRYEKKFIAIGVGLILLCFAALYFFMPELPR